MNDEEELAGTRRLFTRTDPDSPGLASSALVLSPTPTDSPNDPLNWNVLRKYWHATLVLFITAFTAATANDAGAAGDSLLDVYGIPYSNANTGAGVLFLGIGYFTLLASPMPWLYGRKIQYLVCLISSLIGSVWFASVRNSKDSIWSQLFVGASESCAEALAQLSLSELFFEHQRGTVLGIYILATSIGTFLGPLVAGYIAVWNWRWIGWSAAVITGATLIVFVVSLEETSFDRDTILGQTHPDEQKAEHATAAVSGKKFDVSIEDGQVTSATPRLGRSSDQPKTYWQRMAIITPAPNLIGTGFKQYVRRLWHTLRVFGFPAVVYSGMQWGAQDAWLSFYLTVQEDNWFGEPWNYSNQAVAIMNVPTLIGAVIGCIYGGWYSDVFVQWMAKRRGGITEAEDRLWLLLPSAFISPAGLIMFGITSDQGYSWPVPYVGLGMIGFGWGCAGDLSMAYLMDCYPEMILEGMVGVAVINNSLACIFTFTCSLWIDASGLTNTFIAIGVLSFVCQILTLPMIYYGKPSRRWTATRYRNFVAIRDGK